MNDNFKKTLIDNANERVRHWNTKDAHQVITAAEREEIVALALEDTLKEIDRLNSIIATEQQLSNVWWRDALALQHKLDRTNKILDDYEEESKKTPQPQDMNVRLPCDVYWNLRAALNTKQQSEGEIVECEHDQLVRLQERVKIYRKWLFWSLPKVYNQDGTEGNIVMQASQQYFTRTFDAPVPPSNSSNNIKGEKE